jgi:hypothetical protein
MRKFLALLALALGAGAAHADKLYVGAGIANDNLKDVTATASNLNSTNWKVWAGVRPISLFAVEADYIDLGSKMINYAQTGLCIDNCPIATRLHYKAFAGYAVGFVPIPVPFLDVFGKVGLARWTLSGGTSFSLPGLGFFSVSDNGTQFAWGAGGQLHIGNFGARLEYENFNIRNTNGANLVSLSVFLNLY